MVLEDTYGQFEYEDLRSLSYPDAGVILVCFSTINQESFVNVGYFWIPEIKRHCPDTPFIIVGTKTDGRSEAVTKGLNPVTFEMGENEAKKHGVSYMECSAFSHEGIKEIFEEAVKLFEEAVKQANK